MEYLLLSSFLGAIFASFAISLAEAPLSSLWRFSVCDGCSYPLKIKQLVPIFSSFFKIKCRCGHFPSLKYGMLEALLALVFFINILVWGWTSFGILMNAFAFVSFYISLVDWKNLTIPISSLCFLGLISIIAAYLNDQTFLPLLVMWMGSILFQLGWKFFKKEAAMGSADLILFTLSGFWLSLDSIPFFLFLTGINGIIISKLFKRKDRKFPFSPAILLALWCTISLLG